MSKILCYSAGLDSYALSKLYRFDKFIYFNLGTEENKQEMKLLPNNPVIDGKLEIINLPLARFETTEHCLPMRNHFMALIAAQFGSEIYFGFTKGDANRDTDFVFKSQVEGILNYFGLDNHKSAHGEYPYTINMPFRNFEKWEFVRQLLNMRISVEEIQKESRSCYYGDDHECGKCKSCLRRYHAFHLNGIEIPVDKDAYNQLLTKSKLSGEVL